MKHLRCAIYTRKSSEEGLDQDFNSLDAQREACAAYIASQAGEGWRPVKTRYDDGAYSGATMERPALQRLLARIISKTVVKKSAPRDGGRIGGKNGEISRLRAAVAGAIRA